MLGARLGSRGVICQPQLQVKPVPPNLTGNQAFKTHSPAPPPRRTIPKAQLMLRVSFHDAVLKNIRIPQIDTLPLLRRFYCDFQIPSPFPGRVVREKRAAHLPAAEANHSPASARSSGLDDRCRTRMNWLTQNHFCQIQAMRNSNAGLKENTHTAGWQHWVGEAGNSSLKQGPGESANCSPAADNQFHQTHSQPL